MCIQTSDTADIELDRLLAWVAALVRADAAVFVQLAVDEGRLTSAGTWWWPAARWASPPPLRPGSELADPRLLPDELVNEPLDDVPETLFPSDPGAEACRIELVDASEHLGTLILRSSDPGLLTRIRASLTRITATFIAGIHAQRQALEHRATVILRPDDTVEAACDRARVWLRPRRLAALAAVRPTAPEAEPVSPFIGMARVHATEVAGQSGARRVYVLGPVDLPRLSPLRHLTPRQRTVASYAAAGATVAEIADALDRSPDTVKTHLRQVYRRLQVANRVELQRCLLDPARSGFV